MAETNSLLNCRTGLLYRGFESPSLRRERKQNQEKPCKLIFTGLLLSDKKAKIAEIGDAHGQIRGHYRIV